MIPLLQVVLCVKGVEPPEEMTDPYKSGLIPLEPEPAPQETPAPSQEGQATPAESGSAEGVSNEDTVVAMEVDTEPVKEEEGGVDASTTSSGEAPASSAEKGETEGHDAVHPPSIVEQGSEPAMAMKEGQPPRAEEGTEGPEASLEEPMEVSSSSLLADEELGFGGEGEASTNGEGEEKSDAAENDPSKAVDAPTAQGVQEQQGQQQQQQQQEQQQLPPPVPDAPLPDPPLPPLPDDCPSEIMVGTEKLPSRGYCVGYFTVTSPVIGETRVPESLQIRLLEKSQLSIHTVRVTGIGSNSYGRFRLEGTLNVGTFQMVCHKIYGSNKPKTPRKPRPVTKTSDSGPAPPAAPVERRLSQRARKPAVQSEHTEYIFDPKALTQMSCPLPTTPRTPRKQSTTQEEALLNAVKTPELALIRRAWGNWKAAVDFKPAPSSRKESVGDVSKRGSKGENQSSTSGSKGKRSNSTTSGGPPEKQAKVMKGPTDNWVWAFVDEDGDVYEGEMKDGWRHGLGLCIFNGSTKVNAGSNGAVPIGNSAALGNVPTTTGQSGVMYQGEWVRGREQGKGKLMTLDKKVIYDGEWADGKMSGKGTYHFASGGVYEGEWRENQRHGQGVYTLADGSRYEGEWKDDLRSGYGIQTWADGKGSYEGDWSGGMMHGRGTLQWLDGFSYQGQFVENRMEGKG